MVKSLHDIIAAKAEQQFARSGLDSDVEHVATLVYYVLGNGETAHNVLIILMQRAASCSSKKATLSYAYRCFVEDVLREYYSTNEEVLEWYKQDGVPQ